MGGNLTKNPCILCDENFEAPARRVCRRCEKRVFVDELYLKIITGKPLRPDNWQKAIFYLRWLDRQPVPKKRKIKISDRLRRCNAFKF